MRKSSARLLVAGAVVSVGLLASACGGGSAPGVASLGTTTTTAAAQNTGSGTKQQDALKFSKCMRSHGVPNFPEPKTGTGGATQISRSSGIDPNSPTFKSASKACQSLLPKPSPAQVHQAEQNALEFSKCMRSHGVPNFPDPTFSTGGISIKTSLGGSGGLRPTSPAFQAAERACSKYMRLPKGAKAPDGGTSQSTVGVP